MCSALRDAYHENHCLLPSIGVLISPSPDQEVNKLMFLSELREFPSAPCFAGKKNFALQGKKNLMTACVSMLLKSRASLTCFRACFLPGRAKDLSARRYGSVWSSARISIRHRG